jgi:hypothetical protein
VLKTKAHFLKTAVLKNISQRHAALCLSELEKTEIFCELPSYMQHLCQSLPYKKHFPAALLL